MAFLRKYDHDVLGNVTFVRENGAVSGVGVLATYQYDSLSRRSSVTFGNGVAQGYSYDNASRLATQTNDLASTANDLTQTFSYNPAGQIGSVTRSNDLYAWTGHANQNDGSTPNGLNQIGNVGARTVTHDSRGNITAVGTDSYGYSSENFLTTGPSSTILAYDPIGRLYQVASGGTTTRMGYDGLDRIVEYDGSNAVLRRYVHGPGVDNPIVAYEGTGTISRSFLSSDERGSVISLTDSSGTLLTINKYDEYGVPQSTNLGKFGYTGQAWVPEIGLWYYKARFMRPDIGRFMQTDPIGYRGGPNLYAYVLNDPVNRLDPFGLTGCYQYGQRLYWYNVPLPHPDPPGRPPGPPDRIEPIWTCTITPVDFSGFFDGEGGDGRSDGQSDELPIVEEPRQCRSDRNLSATIDMGMFLGYGGGFTLGLNLNLVSGELIGFASARAGTGLGWTAGAGFGPSNAAPTGGLSTSENFALGIGIYGGTVSKQPGGTSISGGASYGARYGAEYSNTRNLTKSTTLIGGASC